MVVAVTMPLQYEQADLEHVSVYTLLIWLANSNLKKAEHLECHQKVYKLPKTILTTNDALFGLTTSTKINIKIPTVYTLEHKSKEGQQNMEKTKLVDVRNAHLRRFWGLFWPYLQAEDQTWVLGRNRSGKDYPWQKQSIENRSQ